jgi:leader peptidase (prepilin peptidase)/N-methyltransferase
MFEAFQSSPALAITSAGLLGLLVGSFLNVVMLRLPPRLMHGWRAQARELLELGEDPADPAPPDLAVTGSHCPQCGHGLSAWENIPLLSFIVLRGRCRACRTPISWQYPLVEALTGVLSAVVMWRFGWGWPALAALVVTWMLVAGAGIDLRTTLLPDEITLPLLWFALLCAAAGLTVDPQTAIIGAAVGYLSLWSVYWAFKLLTGKEGMGYGDFKLLAALGALVGAAGIVPIVLISALAGAIIGSIWLALRGRDRATPIPFGPFLAAGGWIQFLYGQAILEAWLGGPLP